MPGDLLIRWSARFFVACYLTRICLDAAGWRSDQSQRMGRWIWTTGCAVCLIHFALAFHFLHDWRWQEAYDHVRERTREMTGLDSGSGLYVNVLFGVWWLADVGIWWTDLCWSRRKLPYWTTQAVMSFLIIQSTAVFGPRFWIPVTILVVLALMGLAWIRPQDPFVASNP